MADQPMVDRPTIYTRYPPPTRPREPSIRARINALLERGKATSVELYNIMYFLFTRKKEIRETENKVIEKKLDEIYKLLNEEYLAAREVKGDGKREAADEFDILFTILSSMRFDSNGIETPSSGPMLVTQLEHLYELISKHLSHKNIYPTPIGAGQSSEPDMFAHLVYLSFLILNVHNSEICGDAFIMSGEPRNAKVVIDQIEQVKQEIQRTCTAEFKEDAKLPASTTPAAGPAPAASPTPSASTRPATSTRRVVARRASTAATTASAASTGKRDRGEMAGDEPTLAEERDSKASKSNATPAAAAAAARPAEPAAAAAASPAGMDMTNGGGRKRSKKSKITKGKCKYSYKCKPHKKKQLCTYTYKCPSKKSKSGSKHGKCKYTYKCKVHKKRKLCKYTYKCGKKGFKPYHYIVTDVKKKA